jgi:8-oxo-dGTP diphosphatase
MLTIELLAHMDAGGRLWQSEQDERPLSDLGRRQAALVCEALAVDHIDALFSSPALRCRQTLDPVAQRFGLSIKVLPKLRETDGFLPPSGWSGSLLPSDDPLGGAYAAGRAAAAMLQISQQIGEGRVAVCTHGDVLPAFGAFLVGAHDIDIDLLPFPARRGCWLTLELAEDGGVAARLNERPSDFP